MKNILVLAVLLSSCLYAQEDSLQQRLYAGVLANGYHNRGGNFRNDANLMIGAKSDFYLMPDLMFVGRTAYRSNAAPVTHFFFVGTVGDVDFSVGMMPRPMSLLEPDPVSVGGQLLLAAGRVVPGAAKGVSATIHTSASSQIMIGNYLFPGGKSEYDVSATVLAGSLKMGCAMLLDTSRFALAALLKSGDDFSVLAFTDNRSVASLNAEYMLYGFKLYGDGVLDTKQGELSGWEIGWRRAYKIQAVSTVLGFGYGKGKTLRSFVLIHI